MSDLVVINPGSDFVSDGVLTDEGGPIDLTGATLSVFDPPAALAPHVTLTVTNAATGAFRCVVKWSSGYPRDTIMPLRIRLVQSDGLAMAWPAIELWVPAR